MSIPLPEASGDQEQHLDPFTAKALEAFNPPPKPTPAELVRKWIYYRQSGLGRRIHKGFVQSVRGSILLEIAGSPQATGYPLYLSIHEVEILLSQTIAEEVAERASDDPGPRTTSALILYPL